MDGKIVIAVDFGTTYSAVGYAHVKEGADPSEVELEVIDQNWPGQGRRRSPKIPSIFKDGPDGFKYGFQAQDDPERVCFAKLFLDPSQLNKAQNLARFADIQNAHNPETIACGVTKFLRSLRERAFECIRQNPTWAAALQDRSNVDYVLSVPAMWSDQAKDRTLRCAFDAGYGIRGDESSIRLVSEPEAAAIYTITSMPNCAIQVNDVFIVCDAGGGTVDLATYRITALEPALRVEEAATGSGDLCGSVMLNRRFLTFVEAKIGPFAQEYMQDIDEEFNDNIKPSFVGDDTVFSVQVDPDIPNNLDAGLEDGRLDVTGADLKEIFDGVVDIVLLLLHEQIHAVGTAHGSRKLPILLVGGFGSSEYLKTRITETFDQCEVLQPPDAWSAVVRGALKRSMIKKRKIRGAYGVKCERKWNARHEPGGIYARDVQPEFKVEDTYEGGWLCKNHMDWFVKKGEEFSNTKTVSFSYYRNVGMYHNMRFEIPLWAYLGGWEGDDPPHFNDSDCLKIAILKPDLSVIPRQEFQEKRSFHSREKYYKVQYDLEMSFDTMISFKLRFNGKLYGDVEAEYMDPIEGGGHRIE